MKALNVYRTYFPDPPGGLQEAIRQICLATDVENINNTIYTLSPSPSPQKIISPEANIIRNKSWFAPASCDIGGLTAFNSFKELSKQSDLIHYFFPWPFLDVLHTVIKPDKPTVLTYISDVVRQKFLGTIYSPLMWRTLNSVDVIIANSPSYAKTSPVLTHPEIKNKVRIIPLGINENSYPKEGDEGVFTRMNMGPSEPYILFIGVLRYYKGLHTLVEAAQYVNSKIIIAGSGPEERGLKTLTKKLGLKNVIFSGQITEAEKHTLLKHCSLLILPSHLRSEAHGMVLVEASMMAKPMISCEIGTGTSFVNKHNETGLVVTPESVVELSDAMNKLLQNTVLREEMGKKARKRYEALFSGKALGEAYANVYRELVLRN